MSNGPLQRRHYVIVAEAFGAYLARQGFHTNMTLDEEARAFAREIALRNGNCNFDRFVNAVMESYKKETQS